jgi:hypothetical protein
LRVSRTRIVLQHPAIVALALTTIATRSMHSPPVEELEGEFELVTFRAFDAFHAMALAKTLDVC